MRRAQAAALALVAAALGGLLAGFISSRLAVGAGVSLALLVAGVIGERFAQRRVRAWAYCERKDDLLVSRGVLVNRLSVVPYGRMQFVDVVAGPVERFFGLATVRMHTAAAASDARIPGLEQAEADRLRDQLTALGEAKAAGI
jgi:membrane protein YdbS with pleckstrin-like domain